VYGAFVGAAIMQYGPLRSTDFAEYAQVAYGVFLIVAGAVVANGLAGLAQRLVRTLDRRARPAVPETPDAAAAPVESDGAASLPPLPGAALRVVDVRKRFGGLQADRKSTRLYSRHVKTSYAVFCLQNDTDPRADR